jgi:hypothetical protein
MTHCGDSLSLIRSKGIKRDMVNPKRQLFTILKALDRCNVFTWDTSWGNICLSNQGILRLIDFDCAIINYDKNKVYNKHILNKYKMWLKMGKYNHTKRRIMFKITDERYFNHIYLQ